MSSPALQKALEDIVGPDRVSPGLAEQFVYSVSSTPAGYLFRKTPEVVVVPTNTEQVSRVLRLATEERIPVTPRGAGTSGFGPAIPQQRGIVLDLSFMDRIIHIDEDNLNVVVEGGCSVYHITAELFKRKLLLPIVPQYSPGPQAGAGIATNAEGNFANRAGRFGDIVLGLEVVLATGEVVTLGAGALPGDYGWYHRYTGLPDLTGLFVNSCGALGVITKVAFRVQRYPEVVGYYAYSWPREGDGALTQASIELQKYPVFSYRNYNRWTFYQPEKKGLLKLPADSHFVVCFSQDATGPEELAIHERNLRRICQSLGGTDLGDFNFVRSGPPDYALYGTRGLHRSGELRQRVGGTIAHMWFHPISRFPEMYGLWESTLREYGFWNEDHVPYWGAYMSWGNMQPGPMFYINGWDPAQRERSQRWIHMFFTEIVRRGCCLYTPGPPMPPGVLEQQGPAYELFRRIKGLMDPANILCPGLY